MKKNIFENYASLLKNTSQHKDQKYDAAYFKTFYLNKLPKNTNCLILDIGCGNGKYLKILEKLGFQNLYGIDISSEQIKLAKESNLFNVKCIDAVDFLKNIQEKYDVILLIDVLEHLDLEYSIELINLIYSSLKKEGKLFIQVPNALSPFSPLRYSDITHKRAYSSFSIIQTLNTSDFKKITLFELFPYIHGLKSFVRNILWRFILKPLISAFLYTAYGTNFDKIYTANFLCICEK
jgi:2-polyprenyl-3-methyl-5-hydroxy-6-metoxy-1,4-benzoquinol methylase